MNDIVATYRYFATRMLVRDVAVAIMAIDGALWARISAQVYNAPADYERLLALGLRGPR